MRIFFKILAAPFVIILTPTVALLTFLFCYAETLLNILSGVGVLLGALALFTGQTVNGCVLLFLAFLISPLGIPAIAGWLVGRLAALNYALKDYITS